MLPSLEVRAEFERVLVVDVGEGVDNLVVVFSQKLREPIRCTERGKARNTYVVQSARRDSISRIENARDSHLR